MTAVATIKSKAAEEAEFYKKQHTKYEEAVGRARLFRLDADGAVQVCPLLRAECLSADVAIDVDRQRVKHEQRKAHRTVAVE